jgi:hypothetical protein
MIIATVLTFVSLMIFYGYVDKEDHAQPAPVPSPVAALYGHDGPSGRPAHLFVI